MSKIIQRNIERAPTDSEGHEGDVVKMPSRKSIDVANVTRFEVIDHSENGSGREYVRKGISILDVSLQDDGRTLKIFLK